MPSSQLSRWEGIVCEPCEDPSPLRKHVLHQHVVRRELTCWAYKWHTTLESYACRSGAELRICTLVASSHIRTIASFYHFCLAANQSRPMALSNMLAGVVLYQSPLAVDTRCLHAACIELQHKFRQLFNTIRTWYISFTSRLLTGRYDMERTIPIRFLLSIQKVHLLLEPRDFQYPKTRHFPRTQDNKNQIISDMTRLPLHLWQTETSASKFPCDNSLGTSQRLNACAWRMDIDM
jgi:hypothetical protein